MKEHKFAELERSLDNLSLPTIATPLHKERLRVVLLARLYAESENKPSVTSVVWNAFLHRLRASARYVALPALAVVILTALWQGFFVTPPTLAYATLQTNPALQLTVDTRGRVTELAPLSSQAVLLFDPGDFRHTLATQAVAEIIERLHREGYLQANAPLALLLHPAPNADENLLKNLSNSLRLAANHSLTSITPSVTLKNFVISAEAFSQSRTAGLLPLDFIPLLEAEIEEETLLSLFSLKDQLKLDGPTFKARFPAMGKKVAEALREKIPSTAALNLGRKLLENDDNDDEEGKDELPSADENDKEKGENIKDKQDESRPRGDKQQKDSPRTGKDDDTPRRPAQNGTPKIDDDREDSQDEYEEKRPLRDQRERSEGDGDDDTEN